MIRDPREAAFARVRTALALLTCLLGLAGPAVRAETVLRAVMHTDLAIFDPIWSGNYITRNHGYMVYDTLFALDQQGKMQPQMVSTWERSPDGRTWTFVLRDGLLFHDGTPVTAADVTASLQRWASIDATGQLLWQHVAKLEALDDRRLRFMLSSPTGLLPDALGKPSSRPPFILPRRLATTPATQQIRETIGSGPFVYRPEQSRPGDKHVYTRFEKYVPRPEPASALAGGKRVKVDRVEWLAMPEPATQVSALRAGEIDFIESVPLDLLPVARAIPDARVERLNTLGGQNFLRFNVLHKPFDDIRIRQAVFHALNQEDFLRAQSSDPSVWQVCKSVYPCGTDNATDAGLADKLEGNARRARELLQQAGYDGTPVVLLAITNSASAKPLAPVTKALLERAGFKVDMQPMDFQSAVARVLRREPPSQGGWNAWLASYGGVDLLDPVAVPNMRANCDRAPGGWPCDEALEALRARYAEATDPAERRRIARDAQVRSVEYGTHVPLGQLYLVSAISNRLKGVLQSPVTVFWNLEKTAP